MTASLNHSASSWSAIASVARRPIADAQPAVEAEDRRRIVLRVEAQRLHRAVPDVMLTREQFLTRHVVAVAVAELGHRDAHRRLDRTIRVEVEGDEQRIARRTLRVEQQIV